MIIIYDDFINKISPWLLPYNVIYRPSIAIDPSGTLLTPYLHAVFGLFICTILFYLFNEKGTAAIVLTLVHDT